VVPHEKLPASLADFYSRDWKFISAFAGWLQKGHESKHDGLACDTIHDTNDVLLGIDVYTVVEIFSPAGKSSTFRAIYFLIR
jgi:hypothetical protein